MEVGAFEAKTRFSELLRGVEAGAVYTITRKGHPVARLAPLDAGHGSDAKETLRLIREARTSYGLAPGELDTLRRTGRRGE